MVWLSAVTAAFSRVPHEPHVTVTTIASKTDPGMLIAGALALSTFPPSPPPERLIGHPRARS
jgi:hypothetical protein